MPRRLGMRVRRTSGRQRMEREESPLMAVVNILAWVIVGGITGWLASLVVRSGGMGIVGDIVGDIVVGIVGALIGGFALSLLLPDKFGVTGFSLGSLTMAFIGAMVLLVILKFFTSSRAVL